LHDIARIFQEIVEEDETRERQDQEAENWRREAEQRQLQLERGREIRRSNEAYLANLEARRRQEDARKRQMMFIGMWNNSCIWLLIEQSKLNTRVKNVKRSCDQMRMEARHDPKKEEFYLSRFHSMGYDACNIDEIETTMLNFSRNASRDELKKRSAANNNPYNFGSFLRVEGHRT